ncbi:MAG: PAAR-like domain-containing protein [Polyangiaceae bacterium]
MMPAATKQGGTAFAMPDVCLTPAPPAPPTPVPYPNNGSLALTDRAVAEILIVNKETITESSQIPQSMGDEAGTNGGVTSGVNRGVVSFKQGSSKVYAKGARIVPLASMTAHNGSSANAPAGTLVAVSQTTVLVAP